VTLHEKVIIEVALNENQLKRSNPNIPYDAEELAADCKRVYDAGAAIVHYHGRDPETLLFTSDTTINLDAQRKISDATPLIAYGTYGDFLPAADGHYQICSPAQDRFAHLIAMAESDVRFEVGPFDLGSWWDTNAFRIEDGLPDATSNQPVTRRDGVGDAEFPGWKLNRGLQLNNGYDHMWLAGFCRRYGLSRSYAAGDTMHLLNLRNLLDMGVVDDDEVNLKLFFLTGRSLKTRFTYMLELARELFSERRLRWAPVVQMVDGLPVAAMALAEGGDVRTGLGDYHYGREGAPTNADLVERVVALCRVFGREPATPDEARLIKGIAPLEPAAL
jgi:uncharacterized protein (DUF849 family)